MNSVNKFDRQLNIYILLLINGRAASSWDDLFIVERTLLKSY